MKTLAALCLSLLMIFLSCRKDSFITSPDARVTITADTLKYDTLFVTSGSVYQTFKIINENNQKLRLSSIKLMGGPASAYKINVDGISGTQFNNLEINANDSLYVFVQVNVDATAANLPFVIRDSIQVSYNGINRLVRLEAWGQNAHFFRDKIIAANETWINDVKEIYLYGEHRLVNKVNINKWIEDNWKETGAYHYTYDANKNQASITFYNSNPLEWDKDFK